MAESDTSVPVWINVGELSRIAGGYTVNHGRALEVRLPSTDTASHVEKWVADNYPGLALVDWHCK